MADRFGTRRVFASAIGIFTLGSFLCGLMSDIHLLVACRVLQGCGGAMKVPVGRLTLVRTFAKSELVRAMSFVAIPALIGPMLGPLVGGLIVGYLHWRVIFFVNIPIGIAGLVLVYMHLPDYREKNTKPLDVIGLILFGSGIALLSYVLEIFGEHQLSSGEVLGLLALAGAHFRLWIALDADALSAPAAEPLSHPHVFRRRQRQLYHAPRHRRRAVSVAASLSGRAGPDAGAIGPPHHAASRSGDEHEFFMPRLLETFGYRTVLISNTVVLGILLTALRNHRQTTPIWLIVAQACIYGALTSTQYTSMNTLVYADVPTPRASAASTIASTLQQLSLSFGVAAAGPTPRFSSYPTACARILPR